MFPSWGNILEDCLQVRWKMWMGRNRCFQAGGNILEDRLQVRWKMWMDRNRYLQAGEEQLRRLPTGPLKKWGWLKMKIEFCYREPCFANFFAFCLQHSLICYKREDMLPRKINWVKNAASVPGWLVSPGLASVYVNQWASKRISLSMYDQFYRHHTICLAKIFVALHFFENENHEMRIAIFMK